MIVKLIPLPAVSGEEHSVLVGRCLIGRGDDCDMRLDDHTVSRRHAELFSDDGHSLRLRDLESRNGTLVNRDELTGECALEDGDVVAFGMSSFEVRIDRSASEVPGDQSVICTA